MADVEKIKTFLDSIEYREKQTAALDLEKGHYPFITISREMGAGGHSLATAVLNEIKQQEDTPFFRGWQMCDQEVCELIANDPQLHVSLQSLLSSEYHSEIEDYLSEMFVGTTPQFVVARKIFQIIRTLATFGKVVLVEHGSTVVSRSLPLGIHVRLVGTLPNKIERTKKLFNLSEAEARKMIKEQDEGRARLLKTFFNKDIKDPLLYDAVWNTDTVSLEEIARILVRMIRERAARMPELARK